MSKKIGIFVGSLRKESYNRKIANAVVSMFPDGYDSKIIDIGQLEMFNQDFDDENQTPKSWTEFRSAVKDVDAVLFITPEYNRSVPPALKNAVDIASRPYGSNVWDKKPAAIISSSSGGMGAFGSNHHLRQTLTFVNTYTMAQPEAYLSAIHESFDESGNLSSDSTKKFLQSFIDSYVDWISRVS